MIRKLRLFFSSIILTVVLAILICVVSIAGSLITIKYPGIMQYLDHRVLVYGLAELSGRVEVYWIFALVILIFFFAINTVVCTIEKIAAIMARGAPKRSLIPQVVHVGFLIALLGHLVGSVAGFKTSDNVVFRDQALPVPHARGLSVRLDDLETRQNPSGYRDFLRVDVTLLKDGVEVRRGAISLNHPLIYRGMAFYYNDDGAAPSGIKVFWKGRIRELSFEEKSEEESGGLRLTGFYPDFAIDSAGRAYSRSERFVNPYVGLSADGTEAFLSIARPGSSVVIQGEEARLTGFAVSPYVVLSINRDPGIWLVIAGSGVLLLCMVLLLVFGRDKTELIRPSRLGARAAEGTGP
jgi:cytochrome c biogenesis protein ResB